MTVRLLLCAASLMLAAPAFAQQQPPPPENPDEPVSYEEQVVVTASRGEQQLVNAPATVTLITSETIQNSPAINIGDLLRAVPGLNVSQASARDINLTTRGATSTLATSQLALVDGRSVYLDFFGMVMWDLVPTNPNDIRQIEVIRGPASAVWGANAMSGVVNVITQYPARAGRRRRHEPDHRHRRLRPQRQWQRCRRRVAVLCQRFACPGGQRSVGVQAVSRLSDAGSAAAARRARSTNSSAPRIRTTRTTGRRSRSSTRASTTTSPAAAP